MYIFNYAVCMLLAVWPSRRQRVLIFGGTPLDYAFDQLTAVHAAHLEMKATRPNFVSVRDLKPHSRDPSSSFDADTNSDSLKPLKWGNDHRNDS